MNCRILVAGMMQSGSTLLFNIIRFLFLQCYPCQEVYSCWWKKYQSNHFGKIHIVKIHSFDADLYHSFQPNFTILSRRDIRDCVASRIRRYQQPCTPEELADWCHRLTTEMFQFWLASVPNAIIFYYEDFIRNPENSILHLEQALCLQNIDAAQVLTSVRQLVDLDELPERERNFDNAIYANTLMTRSHVTNDGQIGGYRRTLSDDQILWIESHFPDWIWS